jgi:hypothetical protein
LTVGCNQLQQMNRGIVDGEHPVASDKQTT